MDSKIEILVYGLLVLYLSDMGVMSSSGREVIE